MRTEKVTRGTDGPNPAVTSSGGSTMNTIEQDGTLSPRQRQASVALATSATVEESAKAAQTGRTML